MSMQKQTDTLRMIELHLDPSKRKRGKGLDVAHRIECLDGFSMSVQGSEYSYCQPRNNNGPWYEVEIGFPSDREDRIMSYAEDDSCPTETVYGYVPVDVVAEVIEAHGGFKP